MISLQGVRLGNQAVVSDHSVAHLLVDAEHQLFELCLYHQDTSANVAAVTGTKAIGRAYQIVEEAPEHVGGDGKWQWKQSLITACQCVAKVVENGVGEREVASELADRVAVYLSTYDVNPTRDLAWTLVWLSRYHLAMDDPSSCCFRLAELHATARTLAETYFEEVFLLELASLAQAEMDEDTALKIFRHLSKSKHSAHLMHARVGKIRCLWHLSTGRGAASPTSSYDFVDSGRSFGTPTRARSRGDAELATELEWFKKKFLEEEEDDGTLRSYPLVYAEVQAILGSRHLEIGEDVEALAHVDKAAKAFDRVCDPTVHSAYFALESIFDAVLESSNKDRTASHMFLRKTLASPTPNRNRSKSMRTRSRGTLPESDRMADKLALHAQCYLILTRRVTETFVRHGLETRLPDWMRANLEDTSAVSAKPFAHARDALAKNDAMIVRQDLDFAALVNAAPASIHALFEDAIAEGILHEKEAAGMLNASVEKMASVQV